MATKTYLLTGERPRVSTYSRLPGGKRTPYVKPPSFVPFLRMTFTDGNGKRQTIRYKRYATSIYQNEQIKNDNIPANEKFTQVERDDLRFTGRFKITSDPFIQAYLEAYPGFSGFSGNSDDVKGIKYKLYEPEKEIEDNNNDLILRIDAMSKMISLGLEDAQSLYIKLTNSYDVPGNLKDLQNKLATVIDNMKTSDLNVIIEGDNTPEDDMNIFIGKLTLSGIISFDKIFDAIAQKNSKGEWVEIKKIPSSYPFVERKKYLSMFLYSDEGRLIRESLENRLKGIKNNTIENSPVIEKAEDESNDAPKRGRKSKIE